MIKIYIFNKKFFECVNSEIYLTCCTKTDAVYQNVLDSKKRMANLTFFQRRIGSMTLSTLPDRHRKDDEVFCEMLQCEMAKIHSVALKRAQKRKLLDEVLATQEQEDQPTQVLFCPAVSVAQATHQQCDIQPSIQPPSDDAQLLLQLQMAAAASERCE